jgi:hypothetical protein
MTEREKSKRCHHGSHRTSLLKGQKGKGTERQRDRKAKGQRGKGTERQRDRKAKGQNALMKQGVEVTRVLTCEKAKGGITEVARR